MKTLFYTCFIAVMFTFFASQSFAQTPYKIMTGSKTGTYIQIGKDLANYVAPDAGIDLTPVVSKGSVENLQKLRRTPRVKFALVQSDVYQAYKDLAQKGNQKARRLIQQLRVILPLYFEEMHFVVRANSRLNYIHEIQRKRVYFGPKNSGTALTGWVLYKAMFHEKPRLSQNFKGSYTEALKALRKGKVDVVLIVAGQPTSRLNFPEGVGRENFKLLQLDPTHSASKRATNIYYQTKIKAKNYSWIRQDVPTLAVKAFLVTFNFQVEARREMRRFAESLCRNFSQLQTLGHPKWKQVSLKPESLPGGWRYYEVTNDVFSQCLKPSRPSCDTTDRLLGLCD